MRLHWRFRWLFFVAAVLAAGLGGMLPASRPGLAQAPAEMRGAVVVVDIRGAIGVGTQYFLGQVFAEAKRREARLIVMRLDTPGGLVSATRDIIQAILGSTVPVAVYISPSGARAASAGTYISYSAHFAAMAPGTHLGAATPVQMGTPGGAPTPSPTRSPSSDEADKSKQNGGSAMERKIVNDAVSFLRSLAELRGRNAEWAEKAVREAATLTAIEAEKQGVVDLLATDLGDLLTKLEGRTFHTDRGLQKLTTRNAVVVPIESDWRTRFLAAITDPNIAFILLMIGIYGIIFEFWSPGLTGPGIVGGIALVLALMALSALPISVAGASLIVLGIALMIGEALAPGFGILGIGGAIAFALGGVFLFDPSGADIDFAVAWPVVISATATSALLMIGLLGYLMRSRRSKVVSGAEEMIGLVGQVTTWQGGAGRILVHGESWQARSSSVLVPGQPAVVVGRVGLVLAVAPLEGRSPA